MVWNLLVPGILLLGLVIFVHELGHFLMAKWRGVRVLRFSLGFGPALFSFTRGGTEYRLAWIPLGGYVQMAGDAPGEDGTMPGTREEFLSHPWYGRVMIAVAGPLANLITAMLVMVLVGLVGVTYPDFPNRLGATPDTSVAYAKGLRSGDRVTQVSGKKISSWVEIFVANSKVPKSQAVTLGVERDGRTLTFPVGAAEREPLFSSLRRPATPPVVGAVVTGMPAYKAGLKEGDRIVSVNGKPIREWDELPPSLNSNTDKNVKLVIDRQGRKVAIDVTPMNPDGSVSANGQIGIRPPREGVYVQHYSLLESLDLGVRGTLALVVSVYRGMWLTISRFFYYHEYVGGPLFIAQAASEAARQGLDSYLQLLALINIAIMAFNLMPVPVLDGGHVLLAVIQAVRRQAISARAYARFQQVGMVVMATLLVLILANDPWRVFQRQRALGRASSTQTVDPSKTAPRNSAPEEKTVAPSPP